MAGGLFSIDKKYFFELGMYDPGLDVWGGENMEISFKVCGSRVPASPPAWPGRVGLSRGVPGQPCAADPVPPRRLLLLWPAHSQHPALARAAIKATSVSQVWMCGGEIEIVPCSRVGHIFRNDNPYSFPKDRVRTVERNLARVAEVWLDEYKELFYGHAYHLISKNLDVGDLTRQIQLRQKLQCKSFRWYLENVYPDLDAPLVRASGLVRTRIVLPFLWAGSSGRPGARSSPPSCFAGVWKRFWPFHAWRRAGLPPFL